MLTYLRTEENIGFFDNFYLRQFLFDNFYFDNFYRQFLFEYQQFLFTIQKSYIFVAYGNLSYVIVSRELTG